MPRFPLSLDVAGRPVLVVGGGTVGTRRAAALRAAGADVTVIDETRPFAPDDVVGMWLVFACTDDPAVNAAVVAAAEAHGIWCGRADDRTRSPIWMPATTTVDEVQVAVTAGGDPRRAQAVRDAATAALRSGEWPARRQRREGQAGRVVLVGGGPGDEGLLTLRGHRALLDADVVVVDRLAPTGLLDDLPDDVDVIDVGKDPRGAATSQADINALLVARARAGQTVVRLKGGDPFVLGRGSEEVEACAAAGIEVEVVPGVTSATAAATLAGVPLTERGTAQEFTVASGHVPPGDPRSSVDWARLGAGSGTIVLLMAVAHLRAIAEELLAGGRAATTPVVVVENASLPQQRIIRTTLEAVADDADAAQIAPPAVVVIGEVAR